jgi:hypothetical protein
MKKILYCLLFLLIPLLAEAQEARGRDGTGFNSVFQTLLRGNFGGTVSGMLQLYVKIQDKDTICYFLDKPASLSIEYNPEFVYDISKKHYTVNFKGGKIRYTTYFLANRLDITLYDTTYILNMIDGGSSGVFNGLEWAYIADRNKELLFLTFVSDITLSKHRMDTVNMTVKKGSVLCFTIYRR